MLLLNKYLLSNYTETSAIRRKLCGNCAFPQSLQTRKLGEITVFYAVENTDILEIKYQKLCKELLMTLNMHLFAGELTIFHKQYVLVLQCAAKTVVMMMLVKWKACYLDHWIFKAVFSKRWQSELASQTSTSN